MGSTSVPAPILDLSLLAPERPTVLLRTEANPDGELWELVTKGELSIQESAHLDRLSKSVDSLGDGTDLSAKEARLLEQHLDELLEIAFHRKDWREGIGVDMNAESKVAIARAFISTCFGIDLDAMEQEMEQAKVPAKKARRSTGAK